MKRLIVIAVVAVAAAACSSQSDTLAENIAENVEGVNDVDINSDTGEIKIETDEESIAIGGGDIPDDFWISLPSGYSVNAVLETAEGSSVSVMYSRDRFDELSLYFNDWTAADASSWESMNLSVDQAGGTIRAENWSADERGINMTDCFAPDGADALCVILLSF